MRRFIFILTAIILSGFSILSNQRTIPDTKENRILAAKQYLKAVPVEDIIEDVVENRALELPEDKRAKFKNLIQEETRLEAVRRIIVTVMIKHFNTAEIEALADFYEKPEGQSILHKYSEYTAELMPAIQEEILQAMSSVNAVKTDLFWPIRMKEYTADIADEKIIADYDFKNKGPQSVTIKSVSTSCGCTTAKLNKKVFQPGENGTITAIFYIGDRVGYHSELIKVETDEPEKPTVFLELRVTIPELLKITPRYLFWEVGKKAHPKTIQLSFPDNRNIRILGVESTSEIFDAKLIMDDLSKIYVVHLMPLSTSTPVNGKLYITAVVDSHTTRRFPVFLRILPSHPSKIDSTDSSSWSDVLWIDTGSLSDYNESHIPGAILLNEEKWNSQIETVINQWIPGAQIVVYCHRGCRSYQVAQRLREYGFNNIYVIVFVD